MTARYETLVTMVRQHGWTRGAELGVFDGRTHLYLLTNCPDLTLIGVDVWSDSFVEGATKSGEKCRCEYCDETRKDRRARDTVARYLRVCTQAEAFKPRSTLLRMDTLAAAKLMGDGSFDFVFVDGDHSTEGVLCDVAAWRPKIRAGGMLIGHDWNMASVREGVQGALAAGTVVKCDYDDHLWSVSC